MIARQIVPFTNKLYTLELEVSNLVRILRSEPLATEMADEIGRFDLQRIYLVHFNEHATPPCDQYPYIQCESLERRKDQPYRRTCVRMSLMHIEAKLSFNHSIARTYC